MGTVLIFVIIFAFIGVFILIFHNISNIGRPDLDTRIHKGENLTAQQRLENSRSQTAYAKLMPQVEAAAHEREHKEWTESLKSWLHKKAEDVEAPKVNYEKSRNSAFLLFWGGFALLVIVVVCLASGFGGRVVNMIPKKLMVKAGQTCTGIRNGQTVLLPEGTELIIDQDTCDGAIVVAQTQIPTQQAPTTSAPVSEIPSQIPPQTTELTPVAQNFQPVPPPTSGQYFVVQVVHRGVYGKATPWTPSNSGSENYYGMISVAGCGTNVPLPKDIEIYALVDVNQPVYGPEIIADQNGVNIVCDGFNNNILFVVMK